MVSYSINNSGYLHPLYAQSLIEFGQPIELLSSMGWILKRSIPGTFDFDGMGCYPIFTCQDWSTLDKDLDRLSDQLISLSLVTDPFGDYHQHELKRYFKDLARPYKEHFVIDLSQEPEDFVVAHHQRNVYKALKTVDIEVCPKPILFLDEWCSLYNNLIERHNIQGMTRFSQTTFAKQLNIPGIVMFRATIGGKTIGILLWYIQNNVGYYHLGAYNAIGYQQKASFALFWTSIKYFADFGLKWLNLGAGAGVHNDEQDGLTRFKHGWSTDTRTAYLCGRIFDQSKYQKLMKEKGIHATNFFPAYRFNEF